MIARAGEERPAPKTPGSRRRRVLGPAQGIYGYPVDPGAAKLPMMSDAELDELAADIKANGLRWRPTSRSATPTHCARSPSRTAG